jgi:hypothetical protein
MQTKATKALLAGAAPQQTSLATGPALRIVRRGSARPQYAKRLIDMAVGHEEVQGLSREVLAALDPKHRDHRLNAHLIHRGLKEHELPDGRDYRRYFNGH